VNPLIHAQKEAVTRLEPVTARARWGWSGNMDYELDLDLRPMNLVVAPIIPQVGRLDGEVIADLNVPGFLQQLGFVGHAFDKDGAVPFSEGRDFIVKPFLNHTAETITTELNVQVSVSHPNDTDILRTGYLTILLDGIRLKQGQFSPYDMGVTVFYDGVKDLTTGTLAFLWNGCAPIHIWPHIDYDVHSESADYVEHLQVTESCIVERHLQDYLGVGNPSLHNCELQSWYPLPPVQP
jgi:hypothetical protein